ncbi:hypothetical protein ACTU3I_16200 [Microbacterium sp. RD1]|uniref:hypothetical protein n=1 Tax=Microbacterium sp. RD1 TaxID=3457313 RepID=UPI003FA5CCE4
MSGFASYLPLSQRATGDDAAVSSDRRRALADVIDAAAGLLPPDDADAAARRFVDIAALTSEAGTESDPAVRMHALAERVRTGPRRRLRALAAGVRALLILARDRGAPAPLDPLVAGGVALYASTNAPADRRAVISGRTVRASDAEWSFGAGPVLEGTSAGIAAFLLGVSDDPPQPVTPRR